MLLEPVTKQLCNDSLLIKSNNNSHLSEYHVKVYTFMQHFTYTYQNRILS